jgi:hypothetical protein
VNDDVQFQTNIFSEIFLIRSRMKSQDGTDGLFQNVSKELPQHCVKSQESAYHEIKLVIFQWNVRGSL